MNQLIKSKIFSFLEKCQSCNSVLMNDSYNNCCICKKKFCLDCNLLKIYGFFENCYCINCSYLL